jgi:hypothetical protein
MISAVSTTSPPAGGIRLFHPLTRVYLTPALTRACYLVATKTFTLVFYC